MYQISDEAYISISSFLILCCFASPPKDILSCVLLLVSPDDELHIRGGLQLIPSFIVCESESRACSSFTLYLLSFEIVLNVMLHVKQGDLCLFEFQSVRDALLRNRNKLKPQSKTRILPVSLSVFLGDAPEKKKLMKAQAACRLS